MTTACQSSILSIWFIMPSVIQAKAEIARFSHCKLPPCSRGQEGKFQVLKVWDKGGECVSLHKWSGMLPSRIKNTLFYPVIPSKWCPQENHILAFLTVFLPINNFALFNVSLWIKLGSQDCYYQYPQVNGQHEVKDNNQFVRYFIAGCLAHSRYPINALRLLGAQQ